MVVAKQVIYGIGDTDEDQRHGHGVIRERLDRVGQERKCLVILELAERLSATDPELAELYARTGDDA